MQTKEVKSLDELMGGAVSERFAGEMKRVLQNILDPNTDAKKARKIQITVTVKPNENRNSAEFHVEAKSTLAAPLPVSTSVYIGKDKDGSVIAEEVTQEMPGTQNMFTGEVTAPKVINFGK